MAPIQALLLGDDVFPWHDVSELEPDLRNALGDDVDLTVTTDRRRLLDLDEFEVYVDYTSDNTYEPEALDAIRSFVESGGGYLGIHSAADLTSTHAGDGELDPRDEPLPEMLELLGGYFLGHPEQATFGVRVTGDHPVTAGVDDFEVFDEPYRLDHDHEAVEVLATMDHPDDEMDDYAVVWVRERGDGRVCYCSLGHTTEALGHESVRRIFRNGLEWVARE